jgi:4-amino-4-deoxy-L-arabinose transferase-like glycosyltransferase
MEQAISSPLIDSSTSSKQRLIEILAVAGALAVAVGVYALLFNRSNVLSHSIGYNLYASERVLEGDMPYRDFHTLYPPAIFYLNAALFKCFGVSLYAALLGVLIFKVLTVVVIYLGGRQIMPRGWTLVAALSSLLWLRPNGPFKAVPMHYGALFLALAMFLLLKRENSQKLRLVFLAGVSLGVLALFKHNIGAYALAGSVILLLAEDRTLKFRMTAGIGNYRRAFVLVSGFSATIVPVLVYMQARGALVTMIKTLLFGPGEFLLSRLAIPLSPVAPVLLIAALALTAYVTHKLRGHHLIALGLLFSLIAAISVFVLRAIQADLNQIIFYLPMVVLASGFVIALANKGIPVAERRALLIVFIFAAAALMELFPRFAREQSIAAMPFVMLLLFYSLYMSRPAIKALAGGTLQYRLALAVLPMTLALIEGRLFFSTYFDGNLRFKAGARLTIDRGQGVYFPAATAGLIEEVVNYVQQRVPPGGYAFAQSDAGTSFLFLSGRRNVSNAQFWIGVGVTQEERASTLERIDKNQTKLIITSDEVLAAEKYEPMRDYIDRNFKATARFDEVLILER